MRIVGGRWRGRALTNVGKGDPGAHLRPTTDRVRESLFNVLEHGDWPSLDGARVLDLFAGTGALGLEALSRGADHVCFVENAAAAGRILAKNIEVLQCVGEVRVLRKDASRLRRHDGALFDIAFADPPYGTGLGARALTAALDGGWLKPGALVVLEEGREIAVPGVIFADVRKYGDTMVHFGTVA